MKVFMAAAAWGDLEAQEKELIVTAGNDHLHTEYTWRHW